MNGKRRCRSREFRFHFKNCKGWIDNRNYFFCSYCHKYITLRDVDGQTYHETGARAPSEMKLLGGERINRENKILIGGRA